MNMCRVTNGTTVTTQTNFYSLFFVLVSFMFLSQLTPWSRVLLEKLTVTKLVKKFLAFMEDQARFITIHYMTLIPILHKMYPVHNFPPYFPKTHSNIIIQSMLMSSKWSLLIGFSNKNIVCISQLSHAWYLAQIVTK
jgi:hypothetical protein